MNLFGLIGYPLSHSFSKKYFTDKFNKEGINDCKYELFEIESADQLNNIVYENKNLMGLNVTIPHKEAVIRHLDIIDPAAKKIGAVNVIKIQHGQLLGFNSDYFGFKISLTNLIKADRPKALVLGTGGASKAVCEALEDLEITYRLVSRKGNQRVYSYEDLTHEILVDHRLIINTSPIGMHPNIDQAPLITYDALGTDHYLFDLVYNPEETLFMKLGKEQGAKVKNGLEMLHIQAEKAWEIWNS